MTSRGALDELAPTDIASYALNAMQPTAEERG